LRTPSILLIRNPQRVPNLPRRGRRLRRGGQGGLSVPKSPKGTGSGAGPAFAHAIYVLGDAKQTAQPSRERVATVRGDGDHEHRVVASDGA